MKNQLFSQHNLMQQPRKMYQKIMDMPEKMIIAFMHLVLIQDGSNQQTCLPLQTILR